ncbi:SAM-dependent methyltransferase [Amycolatopsis antarctica]|uniref:SAM-dependent methyltransferase n=1 Tax=Amycolatopsis antarctica TaxID=1854586 RepID=A0A263D3A9_9PSEU|nr:class I SAM-dependent methyltransferase [Amycolatopsis antarctica]OZM72962.1 SAM-dependent methyltransferase [Amycolatopsis antarctica]
MDREFEDLVAEAAAVPVDGWDFAWLDGRATEERPSWGYARLLAARMAEAGVALDVQTGGGEVLAGVGRRAPLTVAVESWPPNLARASVNLRPLGVHVVAAGDVPRLPLRAGTVDLVSARHPVTTWWDEIGRVLRPGGTFLSQQVGQATMAELTEFFLGPQPVDDSRSTGRAVAAAERAGMDVVDLRSESLLAEFHDVGAVVYFLRKVVWTVPGFEVDRYRDRLRAMHERIREGGSFQAYTKRFLVETRKRPA